MNTFLTNQFNETIGFNFDSTDFAMTATVSPQITPCSLPTCEWEDDDDHSDENTLVEVDPDLEGDTSLNEGEQDEDDDEDEFEQYMLGDDD